MYSSFFHYTAIHNATYLLSPSPSPCIFRSCTAFVRYLLAKTVELREMSILLSYMNATLPNLKQMVPIKINKNQGSLIKISIFCLGAGIYLSKHQCVEFLCLDLFAQRHGFLCVCSSQYIRVVIMYAPLTVGSSPSLYGSIVDIPCM
jgi:hypothetical protein